MPFSKSFSVGFLPGVLFFAKNPQRFFVDAVMDCALFKGNDKTEILDRKLFRTGLLEQLQEAVVFCEKHLNLRYEGVKNKIINIVNYAPGLRVPQIAKRLNIPAKTIERHMALLVREKMIEFKGSPRTGGYFVKV